MDRRRCARTRRSLQRSRDQSLDPAHSLAVHRGGCAHVRPRPRTARGLLARDHAPRCARGAIGLGINGPGYRGRIGYWVATEARGGGVCTRALRVLSRWALDELALARLELITDPDNLASQRVAVKVGFQREGVLRSHLLHPDGRLRDSVMFSLLPGELVD
ncbi:MAG: GNAT family N-acetyltransferase [Actinobacteria bacterium]|nr:GNAT family N-acetyltransferase [Actinomycetota bacterium]